MNKGTNSLSDARIKIMICRSFDFAVAERLDMICEILKKGKSVMLNCKGYAGNGKYCYHGYKWKMITPIHDGNAFFSTDRFTNKKNVKDAELGIYIGQNLVCKIEESFPTKFESKRFSDFYKNTPINILLT